MNFNLNKEVQVSETEQFKIFVEEFDKNIDFLDEFTTLIKWNSRIISFRTDKNSYFIDTNLIDNSIQTLRSIKLCCSIGSFSDSNTLIRRLRDDLLLYIFILDITNQRKTFLDEDIKNLNFENPESFVKTFSKIHFNPNLTDNEKAVDAWLGNRVQELPRNIKMKLSFENYMKFLKQNENISRILIDYNLNSYWNELTKRLNNYVHNNGREFTNHNLIKHNDKILKTFLKNVNIRTSYITSFFIVLISMVESALMCSTDTIDHLDCGIEPPEDSQYEIAPFIQTFIDEKVAKLHPELKQYLINNNNYGMKIK
ncbi:hypothetical protein [Confluentibacter flavum]|uniref:Uncharacterized protein n=1 Tax=Confluentibacter flavum TaxID=1909700 RepID=A0A2N3HK25_9FLAO|nr:hypothetical protein [Confluentibacter flavum]PKQ45198.1 hypothetical protein CSW08_09270 [Confluentibacter flavum]